MPVAAVNWEGGKPLCPQYDGLCDTDGNWNADKRSGGKFRFADVIVANN